MKRSTAKDFDPAVLQLFDRYVHGLISRREFLGSAARYATAGMSAGMLLEALSPKFAQAQQVAPQDPRIRTRFVEFPSPQGYGRVHAYLAEPAKAAGKLPAVLVVHDNRGLNPHIEDIDDAWRSPISSRWRRTHCIRWAAIRAMRMRHASCSRNWISPRRRPTSWRPPPI